MKDEILYCSDLTQLKQEFKDAGMYDEENMTYTHGNYLTPIKVNATGQTLALVKGNKLEEFDTNGVSLGMPEFPSLQSLGTYEEMFANPDRLALYKSVYPYDIPLTYMDDDDVEQSYFRPKKIGEFA